MKVYLWPTFGTESGQGGIKRVLEALTRWLPEYGVELVDDAQKADLINSHADDYPTDKPMAASLHGLYWSGYPWQRWSYEANSRLIKVAKRAESVSVPSQWVRRSFARGMLMDSHVLMHGIEPEEWTPGESDGSVLWCKTRPDPICDPEPVNVLAQLLPNTQFVTTFGNPDLSNVLVIGRRPLSQIVPYIQKAEVYLGTVRETGGITCLEAMACGVPVLGYDWGANSELVVHQETGFLVPPNDINALKEGFEYCVKHRKRLGEAARQHVLENFTWQKRVKDYLAFYESALASRDRPVKISVVVTAYNLEQYLPACLDSLIAQDYKDWECIVVDDASPDRCGEIADEYAGRDPRFSVIHNPTNAYLAEARNIGFRRARGKYFIALDADDSLAEHTLGTFSKALDKDRDMDIATGGFELVEPDGRHWNSGWPTENPNYDEQIRGRNQVFYASMYRRWVWERTGGYRRRYRTAEDADFWTRAMSFGAVPHKVTDASTLIYANRPDSMSHSVLSIDWTAWSTWAKLPSLTPFGACASSSDDTLTQYVHPYGPPEVSVVVPCGPAHDVYLQDVLDSLVAQTFLDWEVIVVNDTGVSWFDEKGDCNNKYLAGFPFVRIVEGEDPINRGVAWARNAGIEASKSDRFVLMDADDYMQPMMLDVLYKVSTSFGGWVYSDWYDDQGEIKSAQEWSAEGLVDKMLGPSTGMYNKADWAKVGGFDENAPGWEDWSFQLSLLERGICGTRVAQPLFVYRYRTGNRREESFANGANVLKYIRNKHKVLSIGETIMACRSCGGGGGQTSINVGIANPPNLDAPMVLLEYIGPATQTMQLTSKVNRARRYRFGGEPGSEGRKFYAYEADAGWILDMATNFRKIAMPVVAANVTSSLPVLTDNTPAPTLYDRPISDLDLPKETITALTRAGYHTVGEIKSLSLGELVSVRGLGPARARKVQDAVSAYA